MFVWFTNIIVTSGENQEGIELNGKLATNVQRFY